MKLKTILFGTVLAFFATLTSHSAAQEDFVTEAFLTDPVAAMDFVSQGFRGSDMDWSYGLSFTTCSYAFYNDVHPHIFINYVVNAASLRNDLHAGLRHYGFPETFHVEADNLAEIWVNEAARFVRQGKELSGNPHLGAEKEAARRFAASLDAWWEENRDSESPIAYQHFCGGDSLPSVSLLTDPPGGVVTVLSAFAFTLCESLGHSGFESRCGWKVVLGDAALIMATYRYKVRMPDGAESCGIADFEAYTSEPDENVTITVQFPGGRCG